MLYHIFKTLFLCLTLCFSGQILWAEDQTPSDKYCSYMQVLQAKVFQEMQNRENCSLRESSGFDTLIQFINSLMQKVSLENLVKEAIQKKMSFEDFQKWAKGQHNITVYDHYKSKYLVQFISEVCGVITNSATFGSNPDPELRGLAEKQFDPTGYPYTK